MSDIKTETQRGKKKFGHEGFLYCFSKLSADGSTEFWRCEKKNVCTARLHTELITSNVLLVQGIHTHGADPCNVERARHITSIKERAKSTMETPAQIINQVGTKASKACLGQLGQNDALRKIVQRVRKDDDTPIEPLSRKELIIPIAYATYCHLDGTTESFIIADSGPGDADRILILGMKDEPKAWIDKVDRVYLDGTFSLTPQLFSQVFLISVERGSYVFPIAYALLPDKKEATYTRMLSMLTAPGAVWENFQPSQISLDFEKGLLNAAKRAFPTATLQGCLFHLSQNVKKHLRQLNLMNKYCTDPDFALWTRMIPALAFVPPAELDSAFYSLSDDIPTELQPLLDYFEDNYMGRVLRGGNRRMPLFPPALWSVHSRTLAGIGRTNNYAEAGNRKLQREFGVDHPTIFKFIDGLKIFQTSRNKKYEEFLAGKPAPSKRKKYVMCDARILTIVNDWDNRTSVEYLRGIAQNFLIN